MVCQIVSRGRENGREKVHTHNWNPPAGTKSPANQGRYNLQGPKQKCWRAWTDLINIIYYVLATGMG